MQRTDRPSLSRRVARVGGGTSWVVLGSLASGVGAYLFQVVGARALGDEAFAPISVLWTLQYLLLAIALISVEANLTRTVTLDRHSSLRRPLAVICGWLGVTAAGTGLLTYLWRGALFGGVAELAGVAALIVVSYGAFVMIRGWLAGRGRFTAYGAMTGLESIVRLGATFAVLAVATTTRALAWVMPLGPLAVVAWWLRERRGEPEPDGDERPVGPVDDVVAGRTPSTSKFLASTTLANAVSQVLIAAGPIVLIPLGAPPSEVSVFFVTVTAARAPLAFAVGGIFSRILPPLTRMAEARRHGQLRRLALGVAAATAGLCLVGAAAGWWLGPRLVALFFGAPFTPPAWFAAVAAVTVVGACGALVLNQFLIAMGHEQRLVLPWLGALAVAVALVASLSGAPTFRVAVGFAAGEVVAVAALLQVVVRCTRATTKGQGCP